MEGSKPEITLTAAQVKQLGDFLSEHQHEDSIQLRESPNLGPMYVALELLDADDKPTTAKRVLFPT